MRGYRGGGGVVEKTRQICKNFVESLSSEWERARFVSVPLFNKYSCKLTCA